MPIRMEKDPEDPRKKRERDYYDNRRRRPGGGGIGGFLPMILMMLFRGGGGKKTIMLLLAAGAVWYFFLGGQQMLNGGGGAGPSDNNTSYFEGAELDEKHYDKAEVYEPLAEGYGNTLPSATSLLQYAPKRGFQGRQGSCVGWASSYGARTILHARATGADPNSVVFSPSFLYNQIALQGCQGAYMVNAMKVLHQYGDLPLREFPYDERTCANAPSRADLQQASQYRIKGYNRLTVGADRYDTDLKAIKQNLAQGAPVVIGAMVGGSFMEQMRGRDVWIPTRNDYSMRGFGGHAMCVIGYDDNKAGGAFQIMNSWGPQWGNNGVAWIRYDDFAHFTKEAYGLYPMGKAKDPNFDPNKLAVEFGLVNVKTKEFIPLHQKHGKVFATDHPIQKGDKFKIAVANSIECYIYVFGQETDGSSYVLFPYTKKHSPYCGITGTRLFPKDYSMKADDLGSRDRIAILVTKEAIDFTAANQALNASRASRYLDKFEAVIGDDQATNVRYKSGKTTSLECDLNGKAGTFVIIELDKR